MSACTLSDACVSAMASCEYRRTSMPTWPSAASVESSLPGLRLPSTAAAARMALRSGRAELSTSVRLVIRPAMKHARGGPATTHRTRTARSPRGRS